MVVVHPLKERIGLDLLHTCSTNPVLLLTAEPAHRMTSLSITHIKQVITNHSRCSVLLVSFAPIVNMQNKSERGEMNGGVFLPEDEVFGLLWYRHFWWKDQRLSPVHHFPVRLLRRLWAEWRVTCRQRQEQPSFRPYLAWSKTSDGRYVSIMSESLPISISYMMTPRLHQSQSLLYPFCMKTSGAM